VTFKTFGPPPSEAAGFRVLAGRDDGLGRLLVAGGRLPAGDVGPVHNHEGVRPPPPGVDWTGDAALEAILNRLAYDI
jgi:hypothetical protein